jgi:hypothetical protein
LNNSHERPNQGKKESKVGEFGELMEAKNYSEKLKEDPCNRRRKYCHTYL